MAPHLEGCEGKLQTRRGGNTNSAWIGKDRPSWGKLSFQGLVLDVSQGSCAYGRGHDVYRWHLAHGKKMVWSGSSWHPEDESGQVDRWGLDPGKDMERGLLGWNKTWLVSATAGRALALLPHAAFLASAALC